MYAYKEIITINDPQRIELKRALPFRKGQRVEVLILAETDEAELETVRDELASRGVSESDIADAIAWARSKP
jgi:hypothetical protein